MRATLTRLQARRTLQSHQSTAGVDRETQNNKGMSSHWSNGATELNNSARWPVACAVDRHSHRLQAATTLKRRTTR
jgi:hypothetical protein